MNRTELIAAMAEKMESTKKDAGIALDAFINSVGDALVNGEKVTDFSAVFTNADFNEDGILKNPTVYYSDFKEGILTSK